MLWPFDSHLAPVFKLLPTVTYLLGLVIARWPITLFNLFDTLVKNDHQLENFKIQYIISSKFCYLIWGS